MGGLDLMALAEILTYPFWRFDWEAIFARCDESVLYSAQVTVGMEEEDS